MDTKLVWVNEELSALRMFFKEHIREKKMPNTEDCKAVIKTYSVLNRRNFNHIRVKVRYIFSKENSC